MEASTKIALRAIEIANLLAMNYFAALVPDKLQTLLDSLAAQPDDFKVTWAFNGTKHFIEQHAPLAPYRTWLIPALRCPGLECSLALQARAGMKLASGGEVGAGKIGIEVDFVLLSGHPHAPRLVSTSQVCYGCPIATCATYVLWC